MLDFAKVQLVHFLHHFGVNFFLAQFCRLLQGQGNILEDRKRIEKGIILEAVAELTPEGFPFPVAHLINRPAAKQDAPLSGREQPYDVFEEYALAPPALANNGRYVAFVNLRICFIRFFRPLCQQSFILVSIHCHRNVTNVLQTFAR